MQEKRQLKIAKATEQEVSELQNFINNLSNVLEENEQYERDSEVNKEIADIAIKLPNRSFIVPLNCGILLDNYQDKNSNHIEHPKWIMNIFSILEDIDKYLTSDSNNKIKNGDKFHEKIKSLLK